MVCRQSFRPFSSAALCALMLFGSGYAIADEAAISTSPALTLSVEDYRSYLLGRETGQIQELTVDPSKRMDLVLDHHSDVALAQEAERLGIDQRPEVMSQLADYRRQVLISHLMRDARAGVKIPDLEPLARERYQQRKAEFMTPEKRRIAHILLRNDKRGESEEALFARLQDLRKRAMAGEDFAQLAREFSEDAAAESGGQLPGAYARNGALVKPFEDAMFDLKKANEISQPVRTQFGVHLVKLLAVEPGRQIPFDEVKAKLQSELRNEMLSAAITLKRSAAYPDPTTINFDALKPVLDQELERRKAQESPQKEEAATAAQKKL